MAFIFCLVPSHLFFALHEGLALLLPQAMASRPIYVGFGAALGTLCGLLLAQLEDTSSVLFFAPTGLLAGALTSWINFKPSSETLTPASP